ncbi:hypothetical protein [Cecembia rubra]|uniref:hypothetical protein n=1 Tax=Cecembia rubra TaxID=1485585 RepID=UPI002714D3BA|nr:hypothetical protein [Cecembia rubra]
MEFSKITFQKVEIPRYIEEKIQLCALNHLELEDMGKLRDKFDAQAYYDKLRIEILSEYAFEKFLDFNEFDWQSRMKKENKRLQYELEGKKIVLCPFTKDRKPKYVNETPANTILIYLKPERKVYIRGLLTFKTIENILKNSKEKNTSILGTVLEIEEKQIISFSSKAQLVDFIQ